LNDTTAIGAWLLVASIGIMLFGGAIAFSYGGRAPDIAVLWIGMPLGVLGLGLILIGLGAWWLVLGLTVAGAIVWRRHR
jgi:hypothetical protein